MHPEKRDPKAGGQPLPPLLLRRIGQPLHEPIPLVGVYLAADDLTRQSVCYQMLLYIAQNAPIIPVCFERHEVITHRNVITGIEVTSSNVFYNISEWTIKFSD